jgi:hypothetical protein
MSAPTFTVTLNSQLSIVETLNGLAVSPGDNTVTLTGLNETVALTGSTTPPVSAATAFAVTMSGGAATIDLTALPGLTPSETINATGLKGAAIKMFNLDGLTDAVGSTHKTIDLAGTGSQVLNVEIALG